MIGFFSKLVLPIFAVLTSAWAALVFNFSPALPEELRTPAAIVTVLLLAVSVLFWRKRPLLRALPLIVLVAGVTCWNSLNPSNDKNWVPEVRETPWGEISGDVVTLHNIRNFNYRSETDFDANYETRSYNVNELSEVDMLVTYWAGKAIAHVMVSFGFNGKDFISFSIETRKEVGESYSAVNGFFRNYELTYVVADERDVIGVRVNHRVPEERVYVLRTRMALENGRKLFLEYVKRINKLKSEPKFYNTLTTNCTTTVLQQVKALGGVAKYTWKILLSGYVPEYLYETETLMLGMPLEEIMEKSLVNAKAKIHQNDPNFSALIREGVPHPTPRERPIGK